MRAELVACALLFAAGCAAEDGAPRLVPDVVAQREVTTTEYRVVGLAPEAYLVARDGRLALAPDVGVQIGGVPARVVSADGAGLTVAIGGALPVGEHDLDVTARDHGLHAHAALRVIADSVADGGELPDDGPDGTDAGLDATDAAPDAADAGLDATDAGSDAADAGPDATDAGSDATDAGPDATDAGSDAADAGHATTPCPAGTRCTCSSATCDLTCAGSGCDLVCSGSARCDLHCAGGACTVTASGSAVATLDCSGGGCSMHCTGGAHCDVTCGGLATMSCDADCRIACP